MIEQPLRTGDPSATMDRLFRSKHVSDLQLIIAVAFILLLVIFSVTFVFSIENQLLTQWPNHPWHKLQWGLLHIGIASAASFVKIFAPVFAVFGAILAWAYQVGSARLGVVDSFACEISTLCRVAAVVDTVSRWVNRFHEGPLTETSNAGAPNIPAFTSQEDYFPVFDSAVRDLQTLEARVVINITAFYTYMKAGRDSMRNLAQTRPQLAEAAPLQGKTPAGCWHQAALNVVYMLFLGFESARHAIADLVEFEPERAERTIVILISELEAYRFLCDQFPDEEEVHHERILLRGIEYQDLVPRLCDEVELGRASENATGLPVNGPRESSLWEPAWRLLPELRRCYEATVSSRPVNSIPDANAETLSKRRPRAGTADWGEHTEFQICDSSDHLTDKVLTR